jgi:hypothetical protein
MKQLTWVVYKVAVDGKPRTANFVCEQSEWDAMERASPGVNTLVRKGIASEAEAERVAREADGGTIPGRVTLKPRGTGLRSRV